MQYQPDNVSGARESSAGDDFHVLWASRKALLLLVPDTGLKAIGVEGPHESEAKCLDPDGDQLLAVDLSEYYGGECFDDAHAVVLSQLKYSTRHPAREWTAARLCEAKGGSRRGSVVGRLAQSFKGYYDAYGREAVLERLTVKLVSNRPVSKRVGDALACAKSGMATQIARISTATMLGPLTAEHRDDLERLWKASNLTSYEFTDFIRILDVSDCGEGSRQNQRFALVKAIGSYGFGEVRTQYGELKSLIWDRMMPEAKAHPVITRDDVLATLGFSSYSNAFPAQPQFRLPARRVERRAASELAQLICSPSSAPICLHAGGGKGKTLLVHMLQDHLPQRSVAVVFDCYGGGTYLNPADVRHTHSRAILQIANEIAAQTGGALLLNTALSPEDMLRELMGRIKTAVALIRKSDPDAVLVVVIDAADNSIHAACRRHEKSFVHDLLAQPFPDGSRLVVSCRTENLDLLNLPCHELFELGGFDSDESACHLRLYYRSARLEKAQEFHALTHGVPRSQGYVLGRFEEGMDAVLAALRPDGKSLDSIIGDQIHEAGTRNGNPHAVSAICQALIVLPRPVPIEYVATLSDIPERAVESFCVDVGFGLTHGDDGTISFRDQDFEDYLKGHYKANSEPLVMQTCDLLHSRRHSDRYAAYHVGDFLSRLGRFCELCQVILDEDIPDVVTDPLERQAITLQRVQSALRIPTSRDERLKTHQLLFAAADTAKADAAVRKIVIQHPDLVERFGDPLAVQRLHLSVDNSDWPVPDLWRSASVLSRSEATKQQAEEYLRSADGWLRRWDSLRKQDAHGYHIGTEDISHGAEAILRLFGVDALRRWLSGWRPPSVVYRSIDQLVCSLIESDGQEAVEKALSKIKLSAAAALPVLKAITHRNASPPEWLVERTAYVLHRFCRRGGQPADHMINDGLTLCEFAVGTSVSVGLISDILRRFSPHAPDHSPSFYRDDEASVDLLLRHRCLEAISKVS